MPARQPAGTLFSVFAPAVRAADLRPLGAFVAPLITHQLARERFPAAALGPLDSAQASIARPPIGRCSAA